MSHLVHSFATKLNRLRWKFSKNPQNAIDQIPLFGVIGFSTNNMQKTLELMKRPSDKLLFEVIDLSLLEELSTDSRFYLMEGGLNKRPFEEESLADCRFRVECRKNAKDLKSDKIVFVNHFPRNLQEATKVETDSLGLNLFINFKFDKNKDELSKSAASDFHACPKCGFYLVDPDNASHSCLGSKVGNEVVQYKPIEKEVPADLIEFYKKRNCYMEFVENKKENLEDSEARFVRDFLHNFRY